MLYRSGRKVCGNEVEGGEALKTDLIAKLDGMLDHLSFIEERSPQLVEEYKDKLRERVRELLEDTQIEESRLLLEVTLLRIKYAWTRNWFA